MIETFIRFPFYSNIIIAILLVTGIYGMLTLKKSFFPEVKPKIITVSVIYPGASPKEIEEGVTARIEEAIQSIVGIKEVR